MSNNQKINFQINEISQKNETFYINDYKIIKRIGFGSSGLVYKVVKKNDPSNKLYILKQIPYSEPNLEETRKKVQSANNEALILSKLSCKYIVKYYNSFVDSENNLNIIMEYCDSGDLNSFINNLKKENKYLTEEEIWFFFIQISLGLAYIHSKNILHRDLKPMNIFLTNKNQIKIGDLGVAKLLNANSNASTCIGTPYYLSPEICKEKPYNSKGDVWALGCILYELCTFNKPFIASNPAALILKIINGKFIPLNETNNGLNYSEDLKNMIDNILQKDYLLRPLMIDIINSKIFTEKAIKLGFKEDLLTIKSLYEENINNKKNENENISPTNSKEKKNNNNNDHSGKKRTNLLNQNIIINKNNNMNNYINKNNSNSNSVPFIHSLITKKNYLSTGRSTNDSSHNYEISNNKNTNTNTNINLNPNKYNFSNYTNNQNQNEFLYLNRDKNKIKIDLITKPRTKYIKYINKNIEKENSSSQKKNKINKNKIKTLNYKDPNNIELKPNKTNTKMKMFQISPFHFRDSSGGRYNNKKSPTNNNLNIYECLSAKNKINSKEKNYINKKKNIINNLYNINNNYLSLNQNRKIIEKNINKNLLIQNQFGNKNIKNNNLKNIKNNNINEENNINIEMNNNKNIGPKIIEYEYNSKENITNNSKENQNNKNKINLNYINFYDKINLNHLNNININYSLNFIEKTRSHFYNKNFSNIQEPIDSMKMHTQHNFNNLNNFRIENGFENNNDNVDIINNNNNFEKNNCNISSNKSESDEDNNNYFEEEIIEDSGLEDDEDEEKVSIVKENNLLKEKMNKKKEEYIQKYNEYKNKILQYKNIIDIHKLFSLYEKMSKNKNKIDDNTNEIKDYMKNNLNKDIYPKFHKLFKNYIYYDIKIQNLNRWQI